MSVQHQVDVTIRRGRVVRRDFLKAVAATSAVGGLSFADRLSLEAAELRRRGMACILLWMQGGPSQFETFDPKPGHENGGETKSIATSVPGLQFAENLPNLAQTADHLAVVRGMTSREGSHPRATYLLHTGYLPTASIKYPSLSAIAAKEIGDAECELPSFVRIGGGRAAAISGSLGGGFLGVEYDPFAIDRAGQMPANSTPTTSEDRFQRRLTLFNDLQNDYAAREGTQVVADQRKLYEKAARMILSPEMQAFDLSREPAADVAAYGESDFAKGCLLARRLVESGVTFVEVSAGNWDTHQDNFNRVRGLCQQVDQPAAQLIRDLHQRGMLDKTLVIWMGEFGRTPRINPRGGRDHYPAFSLAMAGGGIRGGQVLGKTDESGTSVEDRPVSVPDLFRTFCASLQIDAEKENMSSIGRPIPLVDGGETVSELFG